MSIINLIAAFGGGAFAASIGALPAFIMTGVFAVVGAAASMCGAADAGNILVNYFAFGSSSDRTSHLPAALLLQHTLRKKASAKTVLTLLQHVQVTTHLTFC